MRFGSVCSGIEAASVAWRPLGWECAFVAEIDPFPSAVLAHRFPGVPNLGDFTAIEADAGPVDLLVGGTPCQSFSVAGLRKGMADDRGNLAIEFLRLADRLRPCWVVWENVPGVLSSGGGRDLGSFLGGLVELGYGFAYRVLDAQYVRVDGFGRAVPQRRRRVFVVGHLGDWRRAAAVLFDRESLCGNPPPRRTSGQDLAGTLDARVGGGGFPGTDGGCSGHIVPESSYCLNGSNERLDGSVETFVAHTLRGDGFDAGEDGTGRGTPLVPVACPFDERNVTSRANRTRVGPGLPSGTLHGQAHAVAFRTNQTGANGHNVFVGVSPTLASAEQPPGIAFGWAVRRLTPRECERLQGFPEDWTLVPYRGKPAADGPRYRAIGNSMAVPVMRWIGKRIEAVDQVV